MDMFAHSIPKNTRKKSTLRENCCRDDDFSLVIFAKLIRSSILISD